MIGRHDSLSRTCNRIHASGVDLSEWNWYGRDKNGFQRDGRNITELRVSKRAAAFTIDSLRVYVYGFFWKSKTIFGIMTRSRRIRGDIRFIQKRKM